jgi:hypothetical protein
MPQKNLRLEPAQEESRPSGREGFWLRRRRSLAWDETDYSLFENSGPRLAGKGISQYKFESCRGLFLTAAGIFTRYRRQ